MSWILVSVGLFYLAGGLLVLRAAAMERLLDLALARLTLEPVDPEETRRIRRMALVGGTTAAGGAALLVSSFWAPLLFALSVGVQWQGGGPEEAASRRASILYLLVTIGVMLASHEGMLRSWPGDAAAAGELLGLAALPGLAAWGLFRRLGLGQVGVPEGGGLLQDPPQPGGLQDRRPGLPAGP